MFRASLVRPNSSSRPTRLLALTVIATAGLLGAACSSASESTSPIPDEPETTLVSDAVTVTESLVTESSDGDEPVDDDVAVEPTDEEEDEPSAAINPVTAGVVVDPADVPPVLDTVPEPIQWESCGSIECASVSVPLDHREPDGATIELSVARKRALGESRGSVFVNFGGPGGQTADRIELFSLPGALAEEYDLIGWDPRGTGGTAPLNCGAAAPDDSNELPDASDGFADELAVAVEAFDLLIDCAAANPVSNHIGTIDVAFDLDHLRRAIGEDELDYLGYSYGTQIGWVYASLFPEHVGHFVLDGGVLPGTFTAPSELGRYPVFDQAFLRLDQGCDAVDDCPLNGEGMRETVERLYTELEANPLPASNGESFGPVDLASMVVTSTYYSPEQGGPLVADLIDRVDDGDVGPAEAFLQATSAGLDPAVFWSVICADGLGVFSEDEALDGIEDLTLAAPLTVGVSASLAFCDRVDAAVVGLPDLDTTGAGPILVVGNTGDPATPYAWSVELADRLSDGHLLTYHGGGHTIVGRNGCIDFAVERYFFDDVLPPEGTQCGARPTLIGILPSEVDTGLLIDEIAPGSGADVAGLRVLDIIETVNGQPVDLLSTLPWLPPGEPAVFGIERDGDRFDVDVIPQLAVIDGWTVPIVPQLELP